VRFRRLGSKVLLEEPNLRFRALADDPDARRAVSESFAPMVLWGGEVLAAEPDGRVLVDFTSFVVRDAHGIASKLAASGQGGWSLDAQRSGLDPKGCAGLPDNLELEALLTFTSSNPGAEVRAVAAGEALTFVQHHSLVRLPAAVVRNGVRRHGSGESNDADVLTGQSSIRAPTACQRADRDRVEVAVVVRRSKGDPVSSCCRKG
jgi:hypothetical protein